jgi:hypothetical protein
VTDKRPNAGEFLAAMEGNPQARHGLRSESDAFGMARAIGERFAKIGRSERLNRTNIG